MTPWQFIANKLSFVADWFSDWKGTFVWCLKRYFSYTQELGNTIISSVLQGLGDHLLSAPDLSTVSTVTARINYFFPLSETLGFLAQLLALYLAVLSIKFLLRFLPFGK